jgi:hypothetical protein
MTSLKEITDADAVNHFMLFCSLDSWGEQAEYIRNGMDFDILHRNVCDFLANGNKHSLTFIITMNNLSVTGLQRLLEWILTLRKTFSKTYQRVWFDTPVLRTPSWQSLQILPPAYAGVLERVADWMELNLETLDDPFHGFKDYEVQRLRRDIAWMKEGCNLSHDYVKLQRADFYRFFNEHDQRRGTDFLEAFPEMKEFWNECKQHVHHAQGYN